MFDPSLYIKHMNLIILLLDKVPEFLSGMKHFSMGYRLSLGINLSIAYDEETLSWFNLLEWKS